MTHELGPVGPSRNQFRERRHAARARRVGRRLVVAGLLLICAGGYFFLTRETPPDPTNDIMPPVETTVSNATVPEAAVTVPVR